MQNRYGLSDRQGTKEVVIEEVLLNGVVVDTVKQIVSGRAKVERWVYAQVDCVVTRFGVKQQGVRVLYDWSATEE